MVNQQPAQDFAERWPSTPESSPDRAGRVGRLESFDSGEPLRQDIPMNLRQYSVINFEPSNEAVGEFQVIGAIPSAEYGRTMGSQISIVTRSGSNSFHGAAYEFFRNDALNANDTFSKRSGLPRGTVRHNQFGGSLRGPVQKNKHFFFVNTELLRNFAASETRTSNVSSLDQRRGSISFFDGNGNPARLDLSNQITPLSAKLMALYPSPNSNLPGGNYNAALAIALNDYQYHVRTDHYFSQRDIVTLRTSWNFNDQIHLVDRFGGPTYPASLCLTRSARPTELLDICMPCRLNR